jgi:recombination protein RecA
LMSQALRKLSGAIKQSNTALIFTNQLREKIGIMFGNPETTSGGRALKFYASVRLDIRRIAAIKDKGEVIGNRTRVRVKKNKVAPPFRVAEFDIMYDEGISKSGDLLDVAVELDVIEKRGSYYYHEEEMLAQGRENAKQFLREHPDITDQIEASVRQRMAPEEQEEPASVPETEEESKAN